MRRFLLFRMAVSLLAVGSAAAADEPPATQPAQTAELPPPPEPFTPAQMAWLQANVLAKQPPYVLHFDVFMKGLYQNNQSNGGVWLGNPHPEGDNYSGMNGVAFLL